MEVEPQQVVQREVVVPHPVVGAVDLAVEGEDEGHGVLGDGVGRVARDPHHRHAERGGGREVDVVEAGRPQRDQLDADRAQALERGGAEVVVDEGAHRTVPLGERDGRRRQPRLEEEQVVGMPGLVVGLAQGLDVVGLGAEHGDAHGAHASERPVARTWGSAVRFRAGTAWGSGPAMIRTLLIILLILLIIGAVGGIGFRRR